MSTVELIYDVDCPNVEAARAQLRCAFQAVHLTARWQEWIRGAAGNPLRVEQYGSPTILVDGVDVAPIGDVSGPACRIYVGDEGQLQPVPTVQGIVLALEASRP